MNYPLRNIFFECNHGIDKPRLLSFLPYKMSEL